MTTLPILEKINKNLLILQWFMLSTFEKFLRIFTWPVLVGTRKKVLGKTVSGKKIPGIKVSGKKSPERRSPEKCPQKLSSVKRMLENLNDFFIFMDWFHQTHKKMFDIHLTILHAPNCRTLKESRKVCCRVLGFHRLITDPQTTYIAP